MKNFVKRALVLALFCPIVADAQQWLEPWYKGEGNFYSIRDAYYREERRDENRRAKRRDGIEEEGAWRHFKRWEYFMEPRVYPSGDLTLPSSAYAHFQEYLQQNAAARAQYANGRSGNPSTQSSVWSEVGPIGAPNNGGAGRINAVRFDPVNTDILWACAPAGGLWKSTDGGGSWTNNNDFLGLIGCSDLAIDHTNTQVMYLATGDGDAGDTYSIGVLKSTDGGLTWNPTGLAWNVSQGRRIYKLLIDPTNPQILFAGSGNGIYKTTDGGATWTMVSSLSVYDLEFKPGDPNVIYACNTRFYRSINGGNSWTLINNGTPQATLVTRLAIGVTPADPSVVYLLSGAAGTYGYQGLYRSTDFGGSFSMRSNSPNLLGWSASGNDNDGQAWYTLAIAVSPTDANTVVVGGVNIWLSDDGGQSWMLNAHWYGGGGAPYVHADIHDLIYKPGDGYTIFSGNDGGVFQTNNGGGSWQDISGNMGIAQIYRMGLAATNSGLLITGHQDNGTNLKNGTNYEEVLGGDGMDCFIDWSSDLVMYGELYYGDFNRSTNGGNNWTGITNGLSGSAGWITPWCQDPMDPNTLYAGYSAVFKSTNRGSNWTQLGNLPSSGLLTDLFVAPSNNQVIYTSTPSQLMRTVDGGQNWVNITQGLPTSQAAITRAAVSHSNPDHIWVTFSGYAAGTKVYRSTNGGQTWVNISNGLPNLPANCVVTVPYSASEAVFVGCDVGVYYCDNNSNGFQPYFTGLAHAPVSDLEIFKPTMTLRAATYGRGVWECAIDTTILLPLANFSGPRTACPGQPVTYNDLSTMNASSWSWIMPGATPSTSTQQNPTVTYANPGTYPVTLIASNGNGGDVETKTSYIAIGGTQQLPLVEAFAASTFLPAGWTDVNNAPLSALWKRSPTVGHNGAGCTYFDNYNNTLNGEQDDIRTPMYNLTGYGSATLTFDVAYCRYNATRSDTLEVLVSTDCGQTFTQVYLKGGSTLATKPDQTSAFTPTSSQWRNESISLNGYVGNSSLLVAFRNHGHHGQFLYLDNVNISGTVNAAPVAAFMNFPLAVCANTPVNFTDMSSAAPSSWSWTFNGGTPSGDTQQHPSGVTWSAPGTYTVSLVAGNGNGTDSIAQVITVLAAPAADAGSDTTVCSGTTVQLIASPGVTYAWTPGTYLNNPTLAAPLSAPTDSLTYTVTVTDANGCTASDSVRVNVAPLPAFGVTLPNTICPGDTTQLVCSNPAYSYVWDFLPTITPLAGDSVWVFPIASTPYTVTATDSNGCVSSFTRYVSTYPPVQAPSITVNGNVLTSSSATGNQWYLNGVLIPGATSQSYTATQQGVYTVVVTTTAGCSSSASAPGYVSVQDYFSVALGMSIMPNPNDGVFQVSMTLLPDEEYTLEIFDVHGKLLRSGKISRSTSDTIYTETLNLTEFGAGTYLLSVANDKGRSTQVVIVK